MDLITIFLKGVENDKAAGNPHSKRQKLNIILFYSFALFFSKKNPSSHGTLAFINGNRGYEKLLSGEKDSYYVFHGSFFKKMSNLRKYNSAFSIMNFQERVNMTYTCLEIFFKNRDQIKSIGFWMEFYLLYTLAIKCQPSRIITPGFADRQTTWFAYICLENKMRLEIFQHGLIYQLEILNKIPCSKIYAYDQIQVELFQKYMISNSDCEYEIVGFKSILHFVDYKKANEVLVGIATQINPQVIDEIIDNLLDIQNDFLIILMVHPSERVSNYNKYRSNSRIIIEPQKRYINLDLLITQNSTIAYDYLYGDFKGKIFRIDSSGYLCALDYIDEIVYIKNHDNIKEIVGNYISSLGDEKKNA